MFDENNVPEGFMEITIERGAETLRVQVKEDATISVLIEEGHLRGISTAATRVNGSPAQPETTLRSGDSVCQVPKSGKQGC